MNNSSNWRFPKCWVVVAVLSAIVGLLAFRVFDLGVSLTYAESESMDAADQLAAVIRYQRAPCLPVDAIDAKFSAFEKGEDLVINGVRFSCLSIAEGEAGRRVFVHQPHQ